MYSLKNFRDEIEFSLFLSTTFFVVEHEENNRIATKLKREIFENIFFKSKCFGGKSIEFDEINKPFQFNIETAKFFIQ